MEASVRCPSWGGAGASRRQAWVQSFRPVSSLRPGSYRVAFLEVPLSHLGRVQVSSRSVGHRPSLLSVPPEREAGANIGEGEPGSGQHRAAPGFPRFLATRCFITGPLEACFTDTKVSYEHGLRERRVSYLNQQTDASFIS